MGHLVEISRVKGTEGKDSLILFCTEGRRKLLKNGMTRLKAAVPVMWHNTWSHCLKKHCASLFYDILLYIQKRGDPIGWRVKTFLVAGRVERSDDVTGTRMPGITGRNLITGSRARNKL
jgi:hypothetical protein